jgi:hypothetical protein
VDPKASSIELVVGGRDYTIHQSPGLLSSNRQGGTTGAGTWAEEKYKAGYLFPLTFSVPLLFLLVIKRRAPQKPLSSHLVCYTPNL